MKLTLNLTFTSDWHVGSGSGRGGSVNKLVRRDQDDLPFVPARSLLGMWRDSAETLANSLDRCDGGAAWTQLVEALFGSQPTLDKQPARAPVPGRVQLSPARISPPALRQALASSALLRAATTRVVPNVAIDPATGAAEEDKLFFTELARVGATLQAEATVAEVDPTMQAAVLSFLATAAEGVRAVGGKRRRGVGQCTLRVAEAPDASERFFDGPSAAPALPGLNAPPVAPFKGRSNAGQSPDLWRIRLEPLDPLLIHKRTLGNVVESLDTLPGALLLGALAPTLSGCGFDLPAALSAGELTVRDGMLCVDEARGAPVPRCLSHEKTNKALLRSTLGPDVSMKQEKTFREGYLHPTQPSLIHSVRLLVLPHNVVEDGPQRPTEEVGGVYAYQAIQPGQRYEAVVFAASARRPGLDRAMQALDGQVLRLGRATRADYGRVRVTVHPGSLDPAPDAGDELVLWLRSPLLVRDAAMRPSTDPAALLPELKAQLGVALKPDLQRSRLASVRFESWQRSWGLPRPALAGIAAGSVLVFTGATGATGLDALAQRGLGERRAEGFGEVLINPGWLRQLPGISAAGPAVNPPDAMPDLALVRGSPFGQSILREAALTELRLAVASAPVPGEWARLREPAQLGALRSKVEQSPQPIAAAREWAAEGAAQRRRKPRASAVRAWLLQHAQPGAWPPGCEAPAWMDEELRRDLADEAWRSLLLRLCREAGIGQRDPGVTEVQYGA